MTTCDSEGTLQSHGRALVAAAPLLHALFERPTLQACFRHDFSVRKTGGTSHGRTRGGTLLNVPELGGHNIDVLGDGALGGPNQVHGRVLREDPKHDGTDVCLLMIFPAPSAAAPSPTGSSY